MPGWTAQKKNQGKPWNFCPSQGRPKTRGDCEPSEKGTHGSHQKFYGGPGTASVTECLGGLLKKKTREKRGIFTRVRDDPRHVAIANHRKKVPRKPSKILRRSRDRLSDGVPGWTAQKTSEKRELFSRVRDGPRHVAIANSGKTSHGCVTVCKIWKRGALSFHHSWKERTIANFAGWVSDL